MSVSFSLFDYLSILSFFRLFTILSFVFFNCRVELFFPFLEIVIIIVITFIVILVYTVLLIVLQPRRFTSE